MRISDWSSDVCSSDLVYSSAPTDAEDDDAKTIGIDDIYANALVDYVLYRGYSKDALYAQNASLAAAHHGVFANRSEEHTSALHSLQVTPYAVFRLKNKTRLYVQSQSQHNKKFRPNHAQTS